MALVLVIVSLLCALASAAAYGASSAAQHAAMRGHDGRSAQARTSWRDLLRSPRWLLGMGGDTLGMVLQITALAAGPVVLVQPILVLALPISLPFSRALGGPRPRSRDYLGCVWMLAGLIAFFLLIGRPADARPAQPAVVLTAAAVSLALGGALVALVLRARPAVRAAVFGGVAGCWFGLVAVLIDACAATWARAGITGFAGPDGLVPLIALIVLGGLSIALTQLAFRAGPLAAAFPANLAADPVIAVALGALLVHEIVPVTAGHLLGYAAALAAVVYGAVLLAGEERA
ncbi:DMT family transporter [Gryllotalpicola koreensis]|uniref:DMT family transporter n=1 Tax=Gryllotalpicola koreensis TaxID=993086 RepID=A0ABP7ZX69_9MICO